MNDADFPASGKTCCDHAHHAPVQGGPEPGGPQAPAYYCPMCPGVESDRPGSCPKCGMALERNPAWRPAAVYTCPMHPEIRQDHPGSCPKCGMALEPAAPGPDSEAEDDAELRDLTRRLRGTAIL